MSLEKLTEGNCNDGSLCFQFSKVKNLYVAGPEFEMTHMKDTERQIHFRHIVLSYNCALKQNKDFCDILFYFTVKVFPLCHFNPTNKKGFY